MNEHLVTFTVTSLHKLALFFYRIGYSLVDRRIQNLLITVFKTINTYPPEYLRDLFRLRDKIKNLRGVNKVQVPKPNTTRYGKKLSKVLGGYYLETENVFRTNCVKRTQGGWNTWNLAFPVFTLTCCMEYV